MGSGWTRKGYFLEFNKSFTVLNFFEKNLKYAKAPFWPHISIILMPPALLQTVNDLLKLNHNTDEKDWRIQWKTNIFTYWTQRQGIAGQNRQYAKKIGKNNQTKILYDVDKIHKGSRIKIYISCCLIHNESAVLCSKTNNFQCTGTIVKMFWLIIKSNKV